MTGGRPGVTTRERLLAVTIEAYVAARDPSEFTGAAVAARGGVSRVTLYNHVGVEFQCLRAILRGLSAEEATELSKVRREKEELERRVKQLEAGRRVEASEELAGAIELIERLDAENRDLHDRVRLLEQRRREGGGEGEGR